MPPKNKAHVIAEVLKVHPELDPEELGARTVVQLLGLLKEPVVVEKVREASPQDSGTESAEAPPETSGATSPQDSGTTPPELDFDLVSLVHRLITRT
jgi:hypothetical protein